MRLTSIIMAAFLLFAGSAISQELKIGYADIQAVLVRMPETQTMNQQLQTYEQKLGEQLQVKQQYAQTKLQEYMELRDSGANQETLSPMEEELQKLDQEIATASRDADQKLQTRQQELLNPIITKLQDNIDAIATERGYDIILSKTDGTGSSMVLYGPEEDDVTLALMEKLGIEISAGE